ncbi:sensor histidine kinase [Sphingomonas sp. SRS2]|uniref:sensor histidine kinase n=1 Tax=Sphingomonas sp. SRS2 TaxID=133190 RepID=UPI003FA75ED5
MALLSILSFWLVYFAVATVRSLMIDWGHQTEMLAARAFVTVGSMVATYIVYLAMRPLAGKSLAANVTAVALLSIPAAVAYSSMNWMAFNQLDKTIEAEKAREVESRKFVIDDRSAAAAREQARVAIAAARDAIQQATEEAKAAAEAKMQAQREAEAARAEIAHEIAQADQEAAADQAEALRDAEQARREAQREAAQAQREAYRAQREAYRESQASYREGLREARAAVEEARRHGVNIDIDSILSSVPAPPAPPAPPAIPSSAPPVPEKLAPVPKRPVVPPVRPIAPIEIPMPVISEPTPGTVMIQVGQPVSSHKKDLSVLGQIGDQALNGYFFFAAWGALFLALSYAAAVRTAERAAAGYRAAARDAELRALRYQVNPHFLFNTLNSLSTLILKDKKDDAESMILNLSTFFRTSLTADPTEDVVLAEEIRLQRLYLDIEMVRFPERLIIDINVPEPLANACVPCLILQPLVENAIKYGVSRAKRPVTIKIDAREDSHGLVLSVEDDGEPLGDDAKLHGAGVGLKNVTDRLKARFGDEATCRYGPLANGGFGVTIFMPLIRNVI